MYKELANTIADVCDLDGLEVQVCNLGELRFDTGEGDYGVVVDDLGGLLRACIRSANLFCMDGEPGFDEAQLKVEPLCGRTVVY